MVFQLNWRKKEVKEDTSSHHDTQSVASSSSAAGRSRSLSAPTPYDSIDSKEHRLRIIFNMFDGNEDGKLTAEEVKDFLSSVYDKKYIETISRNWNLGKGLSFQEFLEICGQSESTDKEQEKIETNNSFWKFKPFNLLRRRERKSLNQDFDENELKRAFEEVFDTNRDGVLTKNEFKKVLKNLRIGEAFSDEEIEHLFESVVTKSAGVLKFENFLELLKDKI
ncbi:hypothetical protein C9374_001424 [Naegleria lovaniensis]|uniref:EF-hand domain-containing protein n=1 Tax=Naegleria lovaniensis TaxID=51637 RepID=A0AA88GS17_NAELO|nr:uncharacterized protein C9374_001424 [Naegleria lovaniensis]KAG2387830.1 hypothetical protein C9374_001424 [Naegleria lovaniensis]